MKDAKMNAPTSVPPSSGMPEDDLDGLDDAVRSPSWGGYPLDSVLVRREDRTVSEIVRRIDTARYILDPDFQRTFVWSIPMQSKLIESCLMRIPLPAVYVAEMKDGRIVVVDGLHRLTTFRNYISNKFALDLGQASDGQSHPLNGMRFRDLPIRYQERIEDTILTLYVLDYKAPEGALVDIFERVNSGVPLTRQQMRNSLYNGPATKWLCAAAETSEFLEATGGTLNPKTMRDREVINRFCAFRLVGYGNFQAGDMDGFLGNGLQVVGRMRDSDRSALMNTFKHSMTVNRALFGDHAFRKSLAEDNPRQRRLRFNVALFDVCSVVLADMPKNPTPEQCKGVGHAVRRLLKDGDFVLAITYATNSTKQVRCRFEMAYAALQGAF